MCGEGVGEGESEGGEVNELSLFSGAGGGLLATKHLLGWKTVGYVEIDDYCQCAIQQRIIDGLLDRAPIFGDVKAFISEGYAKAYQGMVDVLTAGFPCQPFSVAGKGKGEQDERNLWPETRDTISIIRPRYIYLENVPNLLTHEYIWTILSAITELGYDCRWEIISAAEVGASHLRKRWWLVGYSDNIWQLEQKRCKQNEREWVSNNDCKKICDPSSKRLEKRTGKKMAPKRETRKFKRPITEKSTMGLPWIKLPGISGMANGVAHRVERIKATGEGQVPRVAEVAWKILIGQNDGCH